MLSIGTDFSMARIMRALTLSAFALVLALGACEWPEGEPAPYNAANPYAASPYATSTSTSTVVVQPGYTTAYPASGAAVAYPAAGATTYVTTTNYYPVPAYYYPPRPYAPAYYAYYNSNHFNAGTVSGGYGPIYTQPVPGTRPAYVTTYPSYGAGSNNPSIGQPAPGSITSRGAIGGTGFGGSGSTLP